MAIFNIKTFSIYGDSGYSGTAVVTGRSYNIYSPIPYIILRLELQIQQFNPLKFYKNIAMNQGGVTIM